MESARVGAALRGTGILAEAHRPAFSLVAPIIDRERNGLPAGVVCVLE